MAVSVVAPNSVANSASPRVDAAIACSMTASSFSGVLAYTWYESPLSGAPNPDTDVSAPPKLNSTKGSVKTKCSSSTLRIAAVMRRANGAVNDASRSGHPVRHADQFVPGHGSFIRS